MMMLTIPLPVYGLFRYLYLIHIRGETAAPDEVLLSLLIPGSTWPGSRLGNRFDAFLW